MSEESRKSGQDKEKEQPPEAKDRKKPQKKEELSEPEHSAHGNFAHEDEFAFGSNISATSVDEEAAPETDKEAHGEPEEAELGGRELEIDAPEMPEISPESDEGLDESFMGGRGLDAGEFKPSEGDFSETDKEASEEEFMGGRGVEAKLEPDGSHDEQILITKNLGQEDLAKERPGDLEDTASREQEESAFDLETMKKKAAATASLKKAAKASSYTVISRKPKAKKRSGFGLILVTILAVILVAVGAAAYLIGPEELLDRVKAFSITKEAPVESEAPAVLSVTSEPPGAEVLWDGMKIGPTPAELTNIHPGRHNLTLVFKDGKQTIRDIELNPGEKRQINIGHPVK